MNAVNSAEVILDPEPASVGRARRWLSAQLEEWGLEDLDYDLNVVMSELVTNSVLHARTPITLRVIRGASVRLEIEDTSPVMPSLRTHGATNTTGRGLHLVSALAASWGCSPLPGGKVVWAEFPNPPGRNSATSGEEEPAAGGRLKSLSRPAADDERPRLRKAA